MSRPARSASPRRPGERLAPYCGLVVIKGTSSLKKPERRKLAVTLDRALALAVRGKLYLFRKRNGDGACLCGAAARAPARPSK